MAYLKRVLAALTVLGVIAFASPAWADTNINVNDSGKNKLAASFPTQECKAVEGAIGNQPLPGKDIWVFNLPGNHATTGDFLSVTANFSTPGGPVSKTAPADGGIVLEGTSKAWIITDAGWTLVDATATISGVADFFVLTHTCPAKGTGQTPSPSPTPEPSNEPSNDPSSPGVPGSTPPLPRTGAPIMGMVVTASIAIAGGAGVLLFLRRRRDALLSSIDD